MANVDSRAASSPSCQVRATASEQAKNGHTMRFCIEYVSKLGTHPYVFGRQLDPGDFQLAEMPTLGGIAIKRSLNQPRKLNPDGTPDLSVFAFELHSVADMERFTIGQVAELGP